MLLSNVNENHKIYHMSCTVRRPVTDHLPAVLQARPTHHLTDAAVVLEQEGESTSLQVGSFAMMKIVVAILLFVALCAV